MVWTEISCFFAFSASIAVRSRSTVASRRAIVDCLIPASCASEYVRGKRGRRRLVFGFIVGLQVSVGRGEDFEDRDIAACGFLFQLHPHDIHHVIEQLDFDACLAGIDRIALCFTKCCLLGVGLAPDESRSQFFRVFDMVATPQAVRSVIPPWAQPRTTAVTKCRWM